MLALSGIILGYERLPKYDSRQGSHLGLFMIFCKYLSNYILLIRTKSCYSTTCETWFPWMAPQEVQGAAQWAIPTVMEDPRTVQKKDLREECWPSGIKFWNCPKYSCTNVMFCIILWIFPKVQCIDGLDLNFSFIIY